MKAIKPIIEITPEEVLKVYSGRPGCGCGCRGSYWVNPSHLERANKERGYAYEGSEISLPNINRVLNIMKKRANEVETQNTLTDGNIAIYAIEDGRRNFWLYAIQESKPAVRS
jgi:hypothetical protein